MALRCSLNVKFAMVWLWSPPVVLALDFHCSLTQFLKAQESTATFDPAYQQILEKMQQTAHPEVPSVHELRLVQSKPEASTRPDQLGPGLQDLLIERARDLKVFDDFKPLSDVRRRQLTQTEIEAIYREFIEQINANTVGPEAERSFLKLFLKRVYEFAPDLVAQGQLITNRYGLAGGDQQTQELLEFNEGSWGSLLKLKPSGDRSSLLPTPYPFFIPAGRFQEGYYWDTYPVVRAMIKTGRLELAQMLVENLLELVREFGLVPNGWRDYYLSRSQPPMLAREVYEATLLRGTPR